MINIRINTYLCLLPPGFHRTLGLGLRQLRRSSIYIPKRRRSLSKEDTVSMTRSVAATDNHVGNGEMFCMESLLFSILIFITDYQEYKVLSEMYLIVWSIVIFDIGARYCKPRGAGMDRRDFRSKPMNCIRRLSHAKEDMEAPASFENFAVSTALNTGSTAPQFAQAFFPVFCGSLYFWPTLHSL